MASSALEIDGSFQAFYRDAQHFFDGNLSETDPQSRNKASLLVAFMKGLPDQDKELQLPELPKHLATFLQRCRKEHSAVFEDSTALSTFLQDGSVKTLTRTIWPHGLTNAATQTAKGAEEAQASQEGPDIFPGPLRRGTMSSFIKRGPMRAFTDLATRFRKRD